MAYSAKLRPASQSLSPFKLQPLAKRSASKKKPASQSATTKTTTRRPISAAPSSASKRSPRVKLYGYTISIHRKEDILEVRDVAKTARESRPKWTPGHWKKGGRNL